MRPEGTKTGRKVSWQVLAALFLVPLLAVGALLGLIGNDDDDKILAAVVNLDEGTEIDGQFVPMGRQLAAGIMDREGQNIHWVLADEASGAEGLTSGEYAARVTIPANFSSAAMSFAANDAAVAEKARIDVAISDNAPAADSALAQEIARIATGSLNDMLTAQYLDGIYLGFNEVGSQFGQVMDGVGQLADGSGQLAAGMSEAVDGAGQLVDGMDQLAAGGGQIQSGGDQLSAGGYQLVDGTAQLADGAAELAGGTADLADGARQLDAGVQEMAGQLPQLTGGIGQLADGADQLAGGLGQVVAGMDSAEMDFSELDELRTGSAALADGAAQVADGLDQVVTPLESLDGLITDDMVDAVGSVTSQAGELGRVVTETDALLQGHATGSLPLPDELTQLAAQLKAAFECPVEDEATCEQLRAAYEQGVDASLVGGFRQAAGTATQFLNSQADPETGMSYLELAQWAGSELSGNSDAIVEGMQGAQQLIPGLMQLRDGARQVADGNAQLAGGIALMVDELPRQISGQMGELRDGLGQLADGADQLAGGLGQLDSQVGALPDGVNQLADGTAQLADGTAQLADGTGQFADGAAELSSGVGAYSQGVVAFVDGVWTYVDGVGQAADGTGELVDGLGQLDYGMGELAGGIGTFAEELSAGADQLPNYTDEDREILSGVVSSPVATEDDPVARGNVSLAAVILVAGVWVAALAAFVVARPIPSDVVVSPASSLALWGRTVGVPTAIVAGAGAVLGLIGGATLSLGAGRAIGLAALLAFLGVIFACTQHALAGWLGHIGRGIALVLLAITVALGLSSALPGWVGGVGAVSPLQHGMVMLRSWLAGAEVVTLVLAGVFVLITMAVLSWGAIATRRQLTPAQFQLRRLA